MQRTAGSVLDQRMIIRPNAFRAINDGDPQTADHGLAFAARLRKCSVQTSIACASRPSSAATRCNTYMASSALVTGPTGYLGSELVKQLLQKGFIVHATVRSPDNTKAVQHLTNLADALPGTLKLFKADLLHPKAFDESVKGCQYVFHTA